MGKLYAAIDIGASSGRIIVSKTENGLLDSREVFRFENGAIIKNGHLTWDTGKIFANILNGLIEAKQQDLAPDYISVDTWGVDFALIDKNGDLTSDTVSYRDKRTQGITDILSDSFLYSISGIQKMQFNTVYQLLSLSKSDKGAIEKADRFLMIPDYINYLLTGKAENEYTASSTTGMLDAKSRKWSKEIIEKAGGRTEIFEDPVMPSTLVARVSKSVSEKIGFSPEVIHCAPHDTASAVLAVPYDSDDTIYLSSGTWSLMGIERDLPDLSEKSALHNFTNEGGYSGNIRYLKNIMGLWMIQCIKKELKGYSFKDISDIAEKVGDTGIRLDVNDNEFLSPDSMIEAVRKVSGKNLSENEVISAVYTSLAKCYADCICEIEEVTSKKFGKVCVLGGGSKDDYLNRLTEEYSKKKIVKGPIEATSVGNTVSQMIYSGEIRSLEEAKSVIQKSCKEGRI